VDEFAKTGSAGELKWSKRAPVDSCSTFTGGSCAPVKASFPVGILDSLLWGDVSTRSGTVATAAEYHEAHVRDS